MSKSRQYTPEEKARYWAGVADGTIKPLPKVPAKKKAAPKKKTTRKRTYRRRAYGGSSRRNTNVVIGYGDYSMGSKVGGYLGQKAGEYLGGMAQQYFLGGFGDYAVKDNVLLAPEPPVIINDSVKGGITFRHKEYLRDVITSSTAGAFSLDSYLLNPGNSKTFPWLSQVSANFEQYSFEGVIFEFRSMSADALNSTNTALGSVIMATNYDSIDTAFKSKGEMENYEWGMSCKPSTNMLHPIECAPRQSFNTELFILDGPVPSGADPRLYHWGNMQIATSGFQGTSVNIGELWVTYQIRLLKPKMFVALGQEIGTFSSTNNSYTNVLPLGNGTQVITLDEIGMIIDPANRNIGFPIQPVRKHYYVVMRWTGSLANVTYPILTFNDCAQTGYSSGSGTGPAGGELCTACTNAFSVMTVPNKLAVVQLGTAGTLPSSGNSMSLRITEINPFNY